MSRSLIMQSKGTLQLSPQKGTLAMSHCEEIIISARAQSTELVTTKSKSVQVI